MWLLYIIALIPLIIGWIIFLVNKQITWKEWLIGSFLGFVCAGIFHIFALVGLTTDVETWSGQITKLNYYPEWVEKYKHAVYKTETYTTGSGKNRRTHTRRVFSHYETRYTTHHQSWEAFINYGTEQDTKSISQQNFIEIRTLFGDKIIKTGEQSSRHGGHLVSGDDSIYTVENHTKFIKPATTTKYFENRIKAAPTTFSFAKVPTNIPVYSWPENHNLFKSDRLINESRIDILKFDQMNSRLGPSKYVNVIMINFGTNDSSIAEWQQAKWIGGKKNDLVLCYGQVKDENAKWAKVFGWTEKEICKRNLEVILLTQPIDNDILTNIEAEIKTNYVIKDWSKFDYITIEPRPWVYPVYLIFLLLTQFGLWIWFHYNEFDKLSSNRPTYRNYY